MKPPTKPHAHPTDRQPQCNQAALPSMPQLQRTEWDSQLGLWPATCPEVGCEWLRLIRVEDRHLRSQATIQGPFGWPQ
jgi:hypothetical protein